MAINIRLILFGLLVMSSPISFAKSAKYLPIGITLNLSGPNAHYDIQFKNGVEALIHAENKSKRFGQYHLKLVVMDDLNQPNRVLANAKRLIKSKKSLALLSTHTSEVVAELTELAGNTKTLLLSANHQQQQLSIKQHRYVGFLSETYADMLEPLLSILKNSHAIYVSSENNYDYNALSSAIQSVARKTPSRYHSELLQTAQLTDPCTLLVSNAIETTANVVTSMLDNKIGCTLVMMPTVDKALLTSVLNQKGYHTGQPNLVFLNSVPLHQSNLFLVEQFKSDMAQYNPQAMYTQQAFKGYILAKLAADSIYNSVTKIETNSFVDVITLPFQVLDKMVGWVMQPDSDVNKATVVNSFSYLKRHEIGLNKPISIFKDRVVIKQSWVTNAGVYTKLYGLNAEQGDN